MNGNGPEFTQAMPFIPNKPVVYAGDVVIGRATEYLIRQLSSPINDFKAGEFFLIHPCIFSFTIDFFHL